MDFTEYVAGFLQYNLALGSSFLCYIHLDSTASKFVLFIFVLNETATRQDNVFPKSSNGSCGRPNLRIDRGSCLQMFSKQVFFKFCNIHTPVPESLFNKRL